MNYKHYRRTLKDSDEKKNLEKMSRPRITFPGLPKVTTRPDQEVQPIETARQKELFGRKAVADIKDQTAPVYNLGSKTGERLVSRKEERAKQAKKIAGKFNRQTVGLNVDTKHGPKSAAITGKLRSKYEEGDEDYATKMAEHKQKRAEAIKAHNQLVDEWNAKAQKIRGKLQQASTPQDREAIMYEYYEHRKTAPKFKAPRAPSKKAKITTALSPEQAALRGKATSATIEHEGFHHIFDDIGHKYGPVAAANARKKILEQHNLEALAEVGAFISDRLGYDRKSSHFTEEVLAHSRDILVNPTKREAFKKFVGTEKADQHIKNLKQGHQKAYEAAKKLTLADIMPVGAPVQEPKKMAASEGLNKNEEDPGLFYQKRFASWKFKTPQEAEEKIRRDVEHGNKQFSELFGRVDYEKDVAPHIHFPQYKSYYVISSKKTKTRNPRQRPEFNTSDELADKQINNHFNLYADPTVRYSKIKEEHVNNILPLETFDEERVQKLVSHIKGGGELPPILLDEGAVADGHHRLEAAKRLKIKKVPVVHILRQDEEPSSFNKNELAKAPVENEETVKLYHITDKAHFKLNPNYAPEDNAIAVQDRSGRKGIYTAPSVEEWVNGHGYARPFVAELHVPKSLLSDKSVGGRWGREKFIPAEHFDKIKVHRVIPIDAHARETYGSHGWFEGESGEEFDTGKPISAKEAYPFKGYRYSGKDAREMLPDEVKQVKQRFARGYKARFGKSELEKGQKGDWKKEGYTISHEVYDEHPDYGCPMLIVSAHHPKHGEVADAHIQLGPNEDENRASPENPIPMSTNVRSAFRRKGIATAMYEHAERVLGRKIARGSEQSDDAKALWSQPSRPFGKSKLVKAPIENYDSSIGREVPEHPMKERYEHSAKSTEVAPGIYHHALFSNRNQEALHMLSNHPDPFYPKATIYSQLLGDAERPAGPMMVQLSQVHPEHKGKGHGKALYEFALKHHGTIHSDELVSPQAEDVYWHLKGKGAEVKFGKPDTRERHQAKYMPGFTPSFRKLAANEKTSYSKEMEKVQTLEHYSPKSGLQAIDPSYQRTGADVRARHHQTEHPHSFYYRKGTALPPEDVHVHGAASSKYEIDIPDDAKLYDLSTDPEGHISSLRQESMSSPINPGVISMDDIHGRLKSLGYHGFYASEHPALSNVVGLYHSMPVAREERLR